MPRTKNILLIDPDDGLGQQLSNWFGEKGWRVYHAHTLMEALEHLPLRFHDVVILEVMLSDATGTDAWSYIRQLSPYSGGILTSASNSLANVLDFEKGGLIAFERKPLNYLRLHELCLHHADGRWYALENQRLELRLAGLTNLLSSISHVSSDQVVTKALAHMRGILTADRVLVYFPDAQKRWTIYGLEFHTAEEDWILQHRELLEEMMNRVIGSMQSVLLSSEAGALTSQSLFAARNGAFGSLIAVPIFRNSKTIGVLTLVNKPDSDQDFAQTHLNLATIIAQAIAISLERAHLEEVLGSQQIMNPDSGTFETWQFRRLVEIEMARSQRYNHPFSLVLFDILAPQAQKQSIWQESWQDLCGQLVDFIRRQLRASDVVGRLSAKEFAILLPETDTARAKLIVERLTNSMRDRLVNLNSLGNAQIAMRVLESPEEYNSVLPAVS